MSTAEVKGQRLSAKDDAAPAEFLSATELGEVTGYRHSASQREWLDKNGWHYVLNASGRPVVGRYYARLRMSGITPTPNGFQHGWTPDFSGLR